MRTRDRVAVVVLVVLCFGTVFLRIHRQRESGGVVLPQRHHELLVNMRLYGHGDDVDVRVGLPIDTDRQSVRHELVSSGRFRFHMERADGNRLGVWQGTAVRGADSLVYSCTVRTERRGYELAARIDVPAAYSEDVQGFLRPTEMVQSDSPEIRRLYDRLVPATARDNVTAIVRATFDYAHEGIAPQSFKGTTDALTCLRLGEASCGGKSRLLAALLRAGGVPARLVGGLILKQRTWTSSHIWVEAWIGGHWVPFCPLNGYFAEVPDRYLILYHGDEALFRHTRDINFRYSFSAKRILAPPSEWFGAESAPPSGTANLWAAFEEVRIPVNLLKIILLLPFGALVVVVFRNVVGVETFGTFMPALMAVAFRDTGLGWGVILFGLILVMGLVVRTALGQFQLLHTPRLAVILTFTVMFILAVALFGVARGAVLPTRVSLFPLAILTLTVERFALMLEEDGPRRSTTVVLGTLLVVAAAYAVMGWEALQVLVLSFPEVLLLVVAAFFIAGRWTGMRLSEYLRFREFILQGERA